MILLSGSKQFNEIAGPPVVGIIFNETQVFVLRQQHIIIRKAGPEYKAIALAGLPNQVSAILNLLTPGAISHKAPQRKMRPQLFTGSQGQTKTMSLNQIRGVDIENRSQIDLTQIKITRKSNSTQSINRTNHTNVPDAVDFQIGFLLNQIGRAHV